jgi:hypothetical protein
MRLTSALAGSALAALSACSLLIETGGLSGGDGAVDARADGNADASNDGPVDATTDAAPERFCSEQADDVLYCEDFDDGFDISLMTCADQTIPVIATSSAWSPPSALELDVVATPGQCYRVVQIGRIATGYAVSFRLRLDAIDGPVRLFNTGVQTTDKRPLLYLQLYPDRIAIGDGHQNGDGFYTFTEPSSSSSPPPLGRWVHVELTIDGLSTTPRSTLRFDGTVIDDGRALSEQWREGEAFVVPGIVITQGTTTLAIDDVLVRRLP